MTIEAPEADAAAKPAPRKFRRAFNAPRPDPDMVQRQMQATTEAFRLMGDAQQVRAFLNGEDAELGGRPVDVAGGSAEGYERVIARMAAITA